MPLRLVPLRSGAEKARLMPALDESDRETARLAPVMAIVAHDLDAWRRQPRQHRRGDSSVPGGEATTRAGNAATCVASLQAAYFAFAVRALGADIGGLSGFDAAAIRWEFLAGATLKVNIVCTIGYGDPGSCEPPSPRSGFREILHHAAEPRL